jgi:hypothetical protein
MAFTREEADVPTRPIQKVKGGWMFLYRASACTHCSVSETEGATQSPQQCRIYLHLGILSVDLRRQATSIVFRSKELLRIPMTRTRIQRTVNQIRRKSQYRINHANQMLLLSAIAQRRAGSDRSGIAYANIIKHYLGESYSVDSVRAAMRS